MESEEDIVWEQTVDQGAYSAKVIGKGEYRGQLIVRRVSDDAVLLDEPVGLSYNALFGPDMADVAEWQEMAITAIDNYAA